MNFIKLNNQVNKYFLEEDSNESPCIVALSNSENIKFWCYDRDSQEYPYVFIIHNLNDLIETEEGEFLTKAFIYSNIQIQSNGNTKSENESEFTKLTVYFRKPKKITFFVNLIQDPALDESIMKFKCPKSGSSWQKGILRNEIIQNLLRGDNNIEIFHNEFNSENGFESSKEVCFTHEINNKIFNLQIKTKSLYSSNKDGRDNMFDSILMKFNKLQDLESVKIFLVSEEEFSGNWTNRGEYLSLNKDEFLTSPIHFKLMIENLLENQQYNTSNLVILKYERAEINKINSQNVICCCSKSFGYNIQMSDLCYYNEDENNVNQHFEVFSKAENLTEMKKSIVDQAAAIFKNFEILFNEKKHKDKFNSDNNNNMPSNFKNFYTTNIALVFKLVADPLSENVYSPVLSEIKTFEESLNIFNKFLYCDFKERNNNIVRTWFNFLFEKSYDYLLEYKTIAVVGYQFSDLVFYEYCKNNKIKLYFVGGAFANDPYLDNYVTPENFIYASLYDYPLYEAESVRVAENLKNLGINGVITFNDEFIPFKVLLQEKLNMKFNYRTTFEEILICKDKVDATNKLRKKAQENNDQDYLADAEVINEENLDKITIDCKKVFKVSKACGSFAIEIIEPIYINNESSNTYNNQNNNEINNLIIDQEKTREKIISVYNEKKRLVQQIPKDFGFGLFFDFNYFLSTFYEGSEHTITLIIHQGKCIWYLISDVIAGKTDEDEYYYEKACYFPSRVLRDDAENEKIKDIIHQNVLDLNLFHCCINVDFIKTKNGIKIIDVNPRPANWYYKDWAKKITGVSVCKADLCLNLPMRYHCVAMPYDSIIKGIPIFSKEKLMEYNCDFVFRNGYQDGIEEMDIYAEACWIERLFI